MSMQIKEVNGSFYVFELDQKAGQVRSALRQDQPLGGGQWFSRATDAGIRYVASPFATHAQARRAMRREQQARETEE